MASEYSSYDAGPSTSTGTRPYTRHPSPSAAPPASPTTHSSPQATHSHLPTAPDHLDDGTPAGGSFGSPPLGGFPGPANRGRPPDWTGPFPPSYPAHDRVSHSNSHSLCGLEALTLRFRDPRIEAAYQAHQTSRFLAVDRAAFRASLALVLISLFVRGGHQPCQPILAFMTLTLIANAVAMLALQSCRDPDHQQRRTPVIAAVRLAYATSYAGFAALCRRREYLSCSPSPAFGRSFGIDTGLITPLFQTIALPLPYRAHMAVSGATVGLFVLLHNQDACVALTSSPCYAHWFNTGLQQHHRLARWVLAAARPFLSRPPGPFSTLHACWCAMLFAQVVAGFMLPGCAMYFVEEAARKRYLAAWRRRRHQHQQQHQQQ